MSIPSNTVEVLYDDDIDPETEVEIWREWFAKATGGAWDGVVDVEAELGRKETA